MTKRRTQHNSHETRRHSFLFWAITLGAAALFLTIVAIDLWDAFPGRSLHVQVDEHGMVYLSRPQIVSLADTEISEPFLVWIRQSRQLPPIADQYAMSVSVRGPWLTVLDKEGQPLGSRPVALASTPDQLVATFYLAATHSDVGLSPAAELLVSVNPVSTTVTSATDGQPPDMAPWPLEQKFSVPIDSPDAATRVLRWLPREVAQRADTLALLFAVVVGFWEWRRWRQERLERERENQIEATASLLQHSWIDGIADLAVTIRRSRHEKWDQNQWQQLETLQKRYCSKDRFGDYLREVGALYRRRNKIYDGFYERLRSGICFGDEYKEYLEPYLAKLGSSDHNNVRLTFLHKLLTKFPDARDVVEALVREEGPTGLNIMQSGTDGLDALRPIIHRIGLVSSGSTHENWSVLPNGKGYQWPVFNIPDKIGLQLSDPAFLARYSLLEDPFTSVFAIGNLKLAPASLRWIEVSPEWFGNLSRRPSLSIVDSFADGVACAAAVPVKLNRSDAVFPISGIVKGLHRDLSGGENILTACAHIAAARWLDLIATTTDAFLAQPDPDRDMIFDLLNWHYGSVDVILNRLTPTEARLGTMSARSAPAFLSLLESEVRSLGSQRIRVSSPTLIQLLEWLSVRPPGIATSDMSDTTVLVALLPPELPRFGADGIDLIAMELAKRRVYVHLIGEHLTMANLRAFPTEYLSWSKNELKAMIDARIASASAPEGPQTFANLTDYIDLGDTNPYTYLTDAAQGSLHRALKYCRVAVEIHQNSGAPGGFTEETLMSARDAVNRDKS